MTFMELDIPLLRKAVEWVEWQAAQPSGIRQWDQSQWAAYATCGATFCVAGKITHDHYPHLSITEVNQLAYGVAKDLLGLCTDDALDLFSEENRTPQQVRAVAERIAGERL